MSKVYTNPENYTAIAGAIREKNGTQTTYKPSQMAAAIRAIETEPTLESLTVTENGTYTPGSGVDGFDEVEVNVQSSSPVIQALTVTENGTYTAPSGVDGYSPVTVNVSGGGTNDVIISMLQRSGIMLEPVSGTYSEVN